MKSISVGKMKLPVLFALFFLFTSSASFAQCESYIPQPANFGLMDWGEAKRPASGCEAQTAARCYDSLQFAFKQFFEYDNTWINLGIPDTNREIFALKVPDEIGDDFKATRQGYFTIAPGNEFSPIKPDLNWNFNLRRKEDLAEFSEVNTQRLALRAQLSSAGSKLKSSGKSSSVEVENILKEIVLTDANFWGENSFEIHSYINSSDMEGDTLYLDLKGNANISLREDSVWLLQVEKSKDIDPKQIIDGNLKPEDLIDDWYLLIGKWKTPELEVKDDRITVRSGVVLFGDGTPSLLDVYYIMIKIKASKSLAEEVISKIDLKPLKNLIYK